MIKVMIVDDIPECIQYYASFISKEPDMEVSGVANSGMEAIKTAPEIAPDIILMDIQMEYEKAGIDAAREIIQGNPDVKIIVVTAYDDSDLIIDAFLVGVVDYIVKMSPVEQILSKIRKVYEHEEFIGPKIMQSVKTKLNDARKQQRSLLYVINYLSKLTKREKNILKLFLKNNSREQIMEILYIEETTLKTHIQNILKKLEYSSVKDMIKELNQLNINFFFNEDD